MNEETMIVECVSKEDGDFIIGAHAAIPALIAEVRRLRGAVSRQNDAISQTLGKALGFPWYKDDQKNFPGATEENGVCVGDEVAESLADLAAARIRELEARLELDGDHDGIACRDETIRQQDRLIADLRERLDTSETVLKDSAPTPAPVSNEKYVTITIRYRVPQSEARSMIQDERASSMSWGDVFAERDAALARAEAAETALKDACRITDAKLLAAVKAHSEAAAFKVTPATNQ